MLAGTARKVHATKCSDEWQVMSDEKPSRVRRRKLFQHARPVALRAAAGGSGVFRIGLRGSFDLFVNGTQPVAQFVYAVAIPAGGGVLRNFQRVSNLLEGQTLPQFQMNHRALLRRQFA